MTKNKKPLIGILVAVVIIGGIGLFIFARYSTSRPKTIPTFTSDASPIAEVVITTDKAEYSQGEEVKAKLSFEGVIYEWDESGWSIQKWENNSWKDVVIKRGYHYPDCKNIDFEEVKECPGNVLLEPPKWYRIGKGGEGNWRTMLTWDQTKGVEKSYKCREEFEWSPVYGEIVEKKCMVFEQVPPGRYKIRFEYATAINSIDELDRNVEIKYAEREFTIK